jgi:uncharacterized membrane protein
MKNILSLDKALNTGWENFKKFGAPSILLWNFIFFLSLGTTLYTPENANINFVYQVVTGLLLGYLSLAIYQFYLKAVNNKSFETSDLLVSPKKILYTILTGILLLLPLVPLAVISIVPLLPILTIPAALVYIIFISIYFSQTIFIILNESIGPIQSLKKSFQLIKGNGFRYILFMACLGTINIIGILSLGVGLLLTGPLTEIIKAQLYINLSK